LRFGEVAIRSLAGAIVEQVLEPAGMQRTVSNNGLCPSAHPPPDVPLRLIITHSRICCLVREASTAFRAAILRNGTRAGREMTCT
jgi:hypothetical protein